MVPIGTRQTVADGRRLGVGAADHLSEDEGDALVAVEAVDEGLQRERPCHVGRARARARMSRIGPGAGPQPSLPSRTPDAIDARSSGDDEQPRARARIARNAGKARHARRKASWVTSSASPGPTRWSASRNTSPWAPRLASWSRPRPLSRG